MSERGELTSLPVADWLDYVTGRHRLALCRIRWGSGPRLGGKKSKRGGSGNGTLLEKKKNIHPESPQKDSAEFFFLCREYFSIRFYSEAFVVVHRRISSVCRLFIIEVKMASLEERDR